MDKRECCVPCECAREKGESCGERRAMLIHHAVNGGTNLRLQIIMSSVICIKDRGKEKKWAMRGQNRQIKREGEVI